MFEIDKNIPLIRNEVNGTQFPFFKRGDFHGFVPEILRMVSPLGEKLIFFNHWTTEISRIFVLFAYIHVVLLVAFLEQFDLCSYLKYSRTNEVL